MPRSLQSLFIESQGKPVPVDGRLVVQLDKIPLHEGTITLTAHQEDADQGISIKADNGYIELRDGTRCKRLHVWFPPKVPLTVTYPVKSKTGMIRLWNIYRIRHSSSFVTEDSWTANAGMIVDVLSERKRRYSCSRAPGPFAPTFVVDVEWSAAS